MEILYITVDSTLTEKKGSTIPSVQTPAMASNRSEPAEPIRSSNQSKTVERDGQWGTDNLLKYAGEEEDVVEESEEVTTTEKSEEKSNLWSDEMLIKGRMKTNSYRCYMCDVCLDSDDISQFGRTCMTQKGCYRYKIPFDNAIRSYDDAMSKFRIDNQVSMNCLENEPGFSCFGKDDCYNCTLHLCNVMSYDDLTAAGKKNKKLRSQKEEAILRAGFMNLQQMKKQYALNQAPPLSSIASVILNHAPLIISGLIIQQI